MKSLYGDVRVHEDLLVLRSGLLKELFKDLKLDDLAFVNTDATIAVASIPATNFFFILCFPPLLIRSGSSLRFDPVRIIS